MASVTLEGVTKIYRDKRTNVTAVNDLSLSIKDREFAVLVGPSGCGKTTTLRIIAGLETLSKGTVSIGSTVVNKVAPKDRDVAMVFQNYALYPHMTVFKNMAFGLKMRHVPKDEIAKKIGEVAKLLGIESLLDRKPSALSGGEKQRVALGRAIVRRPSVFLFDEPLSNLDAKLRRHMRTEIKSLHRRLQGTILYVTHDQEEAMTLGDRIIVMQNGSIRQCGTPWEVYNNPANRFVAEFIGTPPMNFLEGHLEVEQGDTTFTTEATQVQLALGSLGITKRFSRKPVSLGIRPEDIKLGEPILQDARSMPTEDLTRFGEMTVDIIEPLGDTANVHLLSTGGCRLIAKVSSHSAVDLLARVEVHLDRSRFHFFNQDDGDRLA